MRSCLFPGVLAVLLAFCPTVSTAQPDFRGNANAARAAAPRPATAPAVSEPVAIPRAGGMTVSRDTKLTAGDQITILIKEDREPALQTIVTDTGEVELNGLGRVYVAGKNTTEAESLIASYLKQRYYHQATVEVGVIRKGEKAPYKVVVAGKVSRPGPQYFTASNPLKLGEAVIIAGTTLYSNLRTVRLTRGGHSTEHNIQQIMKEGRTELDVPLHDGDQIFVPEKTIIFSGND